MFDYISEYTSLVNESTIKIKFMKYWQKKSIDLAGEEYMLLFQVIGEWLMLQMQLFDYFIYHIGIWWDVVLYPEADSLKQGMFFSLFCAHPTVVYNLVWNLFLMFYIYQNHNKIVYLLKSDRCHCSWAKWMWCYGLHK